MIRDVDVVVANALKKQVHQLSGSLYIYNNTLLISYIALSESMIDIFVIKKDILCTKILSNTTLNRTDLYGIESSHSYKFILSILCALW